MVPSARTSGYALGREVVDEVLHPGEVGAASLWRSELMSVIVLTLRAPVEERVDGMGRRPGGRRYRTGTDADLGRAGAGNKGGGGEEK